ncbi:MAG: hypothetical protein IPG39_06055 [Bacteroidetes bacterium]|nr:hypothetical protein [Bacteroidota bacterium]
MKKYLLILFASFLLPILSNAQVIGGKIPLGGVDLMNLLNCPKTNDNGVIFGGTSSSNISGDKTENSYGVDDYWIVKTNSIGDIQWQNTIGGSSDETYCYRTNSRWRVYIGRIFQFQRFRE